MEYPFKATKISEHVYWVGAVDWSLRYFHGYSTDRGSSYNAFLILGDKITLIDTVKKEFTDELLSRISSVIDPQRIDYIVSHHAELDHSGGLPRILDVVKPQKVYASKMGAKALEENLHLDIPIHPVSDSEKISLGNMSLTCVETKMVHWPESMFTFLDSDGVLFSNDAFGMHLASSERFTDEYDPGIIHYETKKYYANILTPFAAIILKLLDKMKKLNFPIKVIATDHGPVWRQDFSTIFERYTKWSEQKPSNKAVVIYDTMWGSTAKMAKAITDGLAAGGAKPVILPLSGTSRADVATEVLDAGALLVGSPTINNTIFPTVADVMTYLKGLKPKNLTGAAFGSYGWSGEAVKQLNSMLSDMKVDLIGEDINLKYVPDEKSLEKCYTLGFNIGSKLKKNI